MKEVKSYKSIHTFLQFVLYFGILIQLFGCLDLQSEVTPDRQFQQSIYLLDRYYYWSSEESKDPNSIPNNLWQKMEPNRLGFEFLKNQYLYIKFSDQFVRQLKSPVLYADIALEQFKIYQGNELVFESKLQDHFFPYIIPLNQNPSGSLIIQFQSRYHGFIGMDRKVFFKDHSMALVDLFLENFPETFFAPILLVLSTIFLGFYFLRRRENIFLNFSILLFSASLLEALNGFVGFSLSQFSYIITPLTYINFAFFPFALLLFLIGIFPPFFRNLFKILASIHVIVFVISIISNYKNGISFLNSEDDYNWVIVLEAVITIFSSVYVLAKGNKNLRTITLGLLIIVFAGLHDILVDLELFPHGKRIIHYGFFIMLVLFGFYVFKHYWQLLHSINRMNAELRNKNKELQRLIQIDKDLALAHALQKSLLSPKYNEDERIRIIGFSQNLESVGGDYFDHTKDSIGNWAILMADVSGHGISSAMVAAMSKMAFVGAGAYLQFPSRVFHSMNRHLVGKTKNLFITASYVFIDTESYTATFSNAGHPGFFLIRNSESEIIHLTVKGKPLGLFSHVPYAEDTFKLQPGDKILLYTDGIFDLLNEDGESFGEERLKSLLWDNRYQKFQELATIVQDSLFRFSSGWKYQMDDLSFLLVEIK
ncbi:SpoIIE family protein phosphatase [Leptospira sp. 2 VSF19]|uniref:SpoIIE family protein phosphatase n=1 Tax=Leptospira soteropolitanensis TaxID=2950025 RepID=A0AAW5VCT7_9LEPT|nr:SpoIIE family protein phosphatase [Leptospira soteropolitanensis]MCW7491373.1 SpoIIE family protein phosphatase [Leptospira soteropolitanensis]MCW7498958.1 SpoIIE family protein phosphatase [Leptospira soteropolitanensis]MCW7521450.1 SpoIIE family protein phosphatase [Leptospira soteropolitanensis]MCW7525061.1 SpoIIE family protein phosphatase [Leptospira soteropolitanensis]MCW7528929.1 SpoIIE family protein phosphatase [Leptospira soteropolitanensis]